MNLQKKDFANNTQILIIAEVKRLHVHFEFYPPTTKNGKWEWTSLIVLIKKRFSDKTSF